MIRVVSGKHKGLVLKSFELDNIRPTIDRVKEAVFSKIQFDVSNACVLDLFSGTGNLGIEALSRNAKEVVFVDNNKNSINLIKSNLKKCDENSLVIFDDFRNVLKMFSAKNKKFDLIFLDPPYSKNLGIEAVELIDKLNLLDMGGKIVFEHEIFNEQKFDKLKNIKEKDIKKYGTVQVSYLENI